MSEPLLAIALSCQVCGLQLRREFALVLVDPQPEQIDPGWDGIVPMSVVTCEGCGAVDRYSSDAARLRRQATPTYEGRVRLMRAMVLGTVPLRRMSEGLARVEL